MAGTFFVDSNLRLNQLLEILAHKWEIINEFTFYLNGKNGEAIQPPNIHGTPGRPGNVGTNGKNFFPERMETMQSHVLMPEQGAIVRVNTSAKFTFIYESMSSNWIALSKCYIA